MKISIVIPVYNEEKYIESCVQSLINQIIPADEIIVVDNNCTDNTISLIKKYNVKIVQEKKQGMIYARNKGFDEASGDIIARTDADSIIPNDWIKRIKENFEKENIIGLSGPIYFYDTSKPFRDFYWHDFVYFKLTKIVCGKDMLFGPNMSIKKDVWEKVKNTICMDDKKVHEDMDLSFHMSKFGHIKFDKNLRIGTSFRRIKKNPLPLLVDYPLRWMRTIVSHSFT